MIAYEAPLEWPKQPRALSSQALRRVLHYSASMKHRWYWMREKGLLPQTPDAEVFEAAVVTVADYFRDSHGVLTSDWYAMSGGEEPADWVWLDIGDFTIEQRLQTWITANPSTWPPPSRTAIWTDTLSYTLATYCVWRGTLLLVTESLLEESRLHWRDAYGGYSP